jgi:hypothetical protein
MFKHNVSHRFADFNSRHGLDNTRPFADYFPWGVAGDIQQVAITCYNRYAYYIMYNN